VIVASRYVNKNVSTAAAVRAKPVRPTKPNVHNLLANYQIGFSYKLVRSPIHPGRLMNAPTQSTEARLTKVHDVCELTISNRL